MEERYHATTQNRFYPDMSNVNYSGDKTYQPTDVFNLLSSSLSCKLFCPNALSSPHFSIPAKLQFTYILTLLYSHINADNLNNAQNKTSPYLRTKFSIFDIIEMNQSIGLRCQTRATDFTVVPKRRAGLCCPASLQVGDTGFLLWGKVTGA